MKGLAESIRHKKIKGPNQRGFDSALWRKNKPSVDAPESDKRVWEAGLYFSDLLSMIRDAKKYSGLAISNASFVRLLVSLTTYDCYILNNQNFLSSSDSKNSLSESEILDHTVNVGGREFTPDEIISAAGDGLRFLLRELTGQEEEAQPESICGVDNKLIGSVSHELNMAVIYHCASEYWNDCVGNGYGLSRLSTGIRLAPTDDELEVARTISRYRRTKIETHQVMDLLKALNEHSKDLKTLKRICGVPLVTNIRRQGTKVEKIVLGFSEARMNSAFMGVVGRVSVQSSYYRGFLGEGLPAFPSITLRNLIDTWQILQSLSVAIFDSLKPIQENEPEKIFTYSPTISRDLLGKTIAKGLGISSPKAAVLIGLLTFDSDPGKEVWSQPLVRLGDDYCIVVACIHSIHLLRVVETWMRQGGFKLDRRGGPFEVFCRDSLAAALVGSVIEDYVRIFDRAFVFAPRNDRSEEIDLLLIIGGTILIVEAKCVLWPEDSLQFSNYRDTLVSATAQVLRKRKSIVDNFEDFHEQAGLQGVADMEKWTVLCCVLTSSAVYSGFPINGVPITDISMLAVFMRGSYVKFGEQKGFKDTRVLVSRLYRNISEAVELLSSYLEEPPMLDRLKKSVSTREVSFPVVVPGYGVLVHETFQLKFDSDRDRREIDDAFGI